MGRSRWVDHAQSELARAGHRSGGARALVLDLLARQRCCLSAQEIHDSLRAADHGIGLASVYRALDVLDGLGLVHRVEVGGAACFEPADPSGDHHHHAICDSCGERASFEDPELEALIERAGRRLGYDVAAHDITLRGTCPECAER